MFVPRIEKETNTPLLPSPNEVHIWGGCKTTLEIGEAGNCCVEQKRNNYGSEECRWGQFPGLGERRTRMDKVKAIA